MLPYNACIYTHNVFISELCTHCQKIFRPASTIYIHTSNLVFLFFYNYLFCLCHVSIFFALYCLWLLYASSLFMLIPNLFEENEVTDHWTRVSFCSCMYDHEYCFGSKGIFLWEKWTSHVLSKINLSKINLLISN